ncbi:MAG: redoxin domain-containing protein [Planctomycetaceae bacterium]|nr:redoxin domain-containing protein [Planctomycetaceae bacterium]
MTRISLSLVLMLALCGCGDSTATAPNGATGTAEVPTAGTATDLGDPGPPPAGQSEPPPFPEGADSSAGGQPASTTPTDGPELRPFPDAAQDADTSSNGDNGCDGPADTQAAVSVELLDWAGVEQLIASHRGQVVVVDLWSTSCIPCRREFPNLVKLQQELGNRVACISVSTDYSGIASKPAASYREKVLEFLNKQQAAFENVLSTQASDDLFDSLQIGSIPAVFVYNQAGQRVKVFADPIDGEEFTYAEHIRPFVLGLLK